MKLWFSQIVFSIPPSCSHPPYTTLLHTPKLSFSCCLGNRQYTLQLISTYMFLPQVSQSNSTFYLTSTIKGNYRLSHLTSTTFMEAFFKIPWNRAFACLTTPPSIATANLGLH